MWFVTLTNALSVSGAADQWTIRRSNLSLVLRHLRDHGPRSRARIAEETGLNKATVSNLVADLSGRGLVAERAVERDRPGRPGMTVSVDGTGVCGIGAEINVDYLSVLAMDLGGVVLAESRRPLDTRVAGALVAFDLLGDLVSDTATAVAGAGASIAGVTVALPGLVSSADGYLRAAPNLGWQAVPAVDLLLRRLGNPGYPVWADNDANLAALAEYRWGVAAGCGDLLVVGGTFGVGAGVITAGSLVRGAHGYAGGVGHLPYDDDGDVCVCGHRGCWETVVGLRALLVAATSADDPVRDPSVDLSRRLAELIRRGEAHDSRTLAAIERLGTDLGVGVSILVNVLDPAVLVLGGYFAPFGHWLTSSIQRELSARVFGTAGRCQLEVSTLGFSAAVRGGAQLALDAVFDDPTRIRRAPAARAAVPTQGAYV
jgi:predicted NBD/HSP70 family sugar kinase